MVSSAAAYPKKLLSWEPCSALRLNKLGMKEGVKKLLMHFGPNESNICS